MTRRFSSGELSFLRNRIPIDQVVATLFDTPIQDKNGKRQFACPICGSLDTSIHAAHNLVRCFSCRRNFNPIELVMHQLKIGFVDSVKWLQNRMQPPVHQNPGTAKIDNAEPCAIGDILSHVIPSLSLNKSDSPSLESIVQKISYLEHRLRHLDRVVSDLQSSLNR
jgi:hypothetical protein